jgi:hypothetical protein
MRENTSTTNESQNSPAALVGKATPAQQSYKKEAEFNNRLPIQLKPSAGTANNTLERQADTMADKVMRMPETSFIQRKSGCSCGDYDDEHVRLKPLSNQVTPFIQAKGDDAGTASNSVSNRIQSSMGGGNAMQGDTRSFMENRFGADFSDVKIHTGNEPAELNQALNAKAFTVSNNIFFNSGQYQPETDSGKHLLAHELTHVIQQNNNIRTKLIQRKGKKPIKKKPALTSCCYTGSVSTKKEIHLNIGVPGVRIYSGTPASHTFVEFKNIIVGPKTKKEVRCQMYAIQDKQKLSGKGLINFVNYDGDFGFHSDFWRHKSGKKLDKDPTPIPGEHSHGCARLRDGDAASVHKADSESFFDAVDKGDCVRVYSSAKWADPTFQACSNGTPCAAAPVQGPQLEGDGPHKKDPDPKPVPVPKKDIPVG